MNLKQLRDQELLQNTKDLVQTERTTLTKILEHLREIERRKLYADLGCASLFEYAVKHLQYSEGQAGRRIQAMRLIKEIPEVAAKIESGALSLSNISQAQSFFRDLAQSNSSQVNISQNKNSTVETTTAGKLKVLALLENKSSREGQRELLQLGGPCALPQERERVIDDTRSEVKFIMTSDLKNKLEEVRSLLGPEGAMLNLGELIDRLATISTESLKTKKFGKHHLKSATPTKSSAPAPEPAVESTRSTSPRYISKQVKSLVWQRDRGSCRSCGSRRGLNYDHVRPVARGGLATLENLRLLCFACNQRAGIKAGLVPMGRD